jgi:hypothetical protein
MDQQLRALAPLPTGVVTKLAGYTNSNTLSGYRARGARMPDRKLEQLASSLERLARAARALKVTP